jgi:hypothetical protein
MSGSPTSRQHRRLGHFARVSSTSSRNPDASACPNASPAIRSRMPICRQIAYPSSAYWAANTNSPTRHSSSARWTSSPASVSSSPCSAAHRAATRSLHTSWSSTAGASAHARSVKGKQSSARARSALPRVVRSRRLVVTPRRLRFARSATRGQSAPRMECDSDEASRSARQHGSGCRTDGLACSARPMMVSLRRRTGGSCCGALRYEARSIAATLFGRLDGAGVMSFRAARRHTHYELDHR